MSNKTHRNAQTLGERSESIVDWLQLHTREVVIGAVVVVVLIGGGWMYKRSAASTASRAEAAYFQARGAAASGNAPLAHAELEKVITRFGGTTAAVQSAMLQAQLYYDEGNYAEGMKALESASGRRVAADQRAAITGLEATGLVGQAKYKEAAERYLGAANAAPFALDKAQFKSEAAQAYTLAGDTAKALELWTELAADETSPMAAEARVRLGELEAASAKG